MIETIYFKMGFSRFFQSLGKLSWVAVGLFIANCTHLPSPGGSVESIDLSNSYAVKNIEELNKKNAATNLKDPRAYYHYLMALKADQEGQFETAAQHYGKVIQFDPNLVEFYEVWTKLLLRSGEFDKVVQACEQGLQRFPHDPQLNMMMGDILYSRKEHKRAALYYEKVTNIEPANSRAHLLRGIALESMNKFDEATEMYQQMIIADSDNPLGQYFLARSEVRAADLDKAEKSLKEAVSLRPSFAKARRLLAVVLEKNGKADEAIQEYRLLLKLDPQSKKIRNHLTMLLKPKGLFDSQIGNLESDLREALDDIEPHLEIGIIYYQQAQYLESLDEFQLVLARGDNWEIHFLLAKLFETLGRLDRAIQEYETLQTHQPNSVTLLMYLSRLYNMNNQTRDSIRLINQAVQLEPENDTLFHSLALAYMAVKNHDLAIENMRRAINLNSAKDSYYFELGALLEKAGEYEGAIGSMKRALELNPMHSNAHNFIGYMYALSGKELDKAEEHLRKAISIQPKNGYFLDSLGWIYYKKGESDRALSEIKKALIYTSPDPVLYNHLGDVHYSLKNYHEASRAWKTSLSLTNASEDDLEGELPNPGDLEIKIEKAIKLLGKN